MAKTPLFARLSRALRTAVTLERRGISTSEAIDRSEERALSRRQVMQALGVTAGAIAMGATAPACVVSASDEKTGATGSAVDRSKRIVIVGAGLAGLTTAFRLAQHGYVPRVYDANTRVGGRTFTLRNHFTSKVELGGELIDTGHTSLQQLVADLGLTLVDQAAAVSSYERERYFIGGRHYTEAEIIHLFRPIARKLDADYAAQGPDIASYAAFNAVQRRLDRTSIHDWFDQHHFSGPMRTLLEGAYTSEYGRETTEQTYLNMLYLIGTTTPPFDIYGVSDERFTIREGNDAVASRIASSLARPVELEHRLVSVRAKSDGSLEAIFDHDGRSVHVVADKLVLALPFTQLRTCELHGLAITAPQRLAIDTLGYGTNSKLMIGTSTRPWYADGGSGTSFTDAAYNESWESSRGYPGPRGAMTSFTAGELGLSIANGSVQSQAAAFLAQLDRVYPGSRAAYDGKAVRMVWGTAKHFEGSYACYAPGSYTSFSGAEQLQVGNVHVCGEHTSTDYQGFMEGAVGSGERVVAEIEADLG